MTNNLVQCPSCLGTGEIMEGKKSKKGFEYKCCKLCEGKGKVLKVLEEDYISSINNIHYD